MRPLHRRCRGALPAALLALVVAGALAAQEAGERLLLDAERSEQDGDLSSALRDYEMISRQFPGTDVAGRALLRLVGGLRRTADLPAAVAACNRLIDDFPASSYAAAGLFHLGELQAEGARAPEETVAARDAFRRVWVLFDAAAYPDLAYRAAARVRSAELEQRAGDLEAAELSYLATLDGEPVSEWSLRARLGLGRLYLDRGDWVLAAETLQQAIDEAVSLALEEPAADARASLTLVHRAMLRPAAGAPRWQTGRRVGGVTLGAKPGGVAASGDGRIVVVDESSARAVLLDGDAVVATRTLAEASRPFFGRDGRALVPAGAAVWEVVSGDQQAFPGPAKAPVRRLGGGGEGTFQWFTYEEKPNRVLAYRHDTPAGRELAVGEPVDVATDGQGRLHVLNREGVLRFDSAASTAATLVSGLEKAIALDVDALGNVYVLDRGGRLTVFDRRGQKLATLGPALPGGLSLGSAVDLAVDASGRVFVLDAKPPALYVLE